MPTTTMLPPLTVKLEQVSNPDKLLRYQRQWLEKRVPPTGFRALFAPKTPSTTRADYQAGCLLAAIIALLDKTPGRPAPTVPNIAALALYPDALLIRELLEKQVDLTIPLSFDPTGWTFDKSDHEVLGFDRHLLADAKDLDEGRRATAQQQLNGITDSLHEFFKQLPPTQESIDVVAAYVQQFQKKSFGKAVPGDLWLKTPASKTPIRALPASMYQYNNSYSQNKLVLGGAGSGRSIMMARLCEIAHEKGNKVVMITFRQAQGTLYHLALRKEGAIRKIATRSQAAFNPFWFPDRFTNLDGELSERVLSYLADLLVCLVETASAKLPAVFRSYLPSLLIAYYKQQPWQAKGTTPSFDSFYDFMSSVAANGWGAGLARPCPRCGAGAGCQTNEGHNPVYALTAFLEAGQPFYGTRELAYLMNAEPTKARDLFTPQNNLLYLEMAVGYPGDELADAVVTQCISWLVLFGVDMHLGWSGREEHHSQQRMTLAVDELLDQCLTSTGKTFIQPFLRSKRQNAQELICAWHNQPKYVFSKEHEVANEIRDAAGCYVLLASGPTWHKEGGLQLSDHYKVQYESLDRRQVLIVGLQDFEGVYDMSMSQEEVHKYYPRPVGE